MPRALLGGGTCRRCGSFRADAGSCARCRAVWSPAAGTTPASQPALSGVVRATPGRRYLADLIDLLPPLLAVAGAVAVFTTAVRTAPGWALVAIAAAVALAELAWLFATGRSIGRLLLGLRTVDDLTGTPIGFVRPGRHLLGAATRSRLLTADLRHGRDPMQPRLQPTPLAGSGDAADGWAPGAFLADHRSRAARSLTARSVVWVLLENGARRELRRRPMLIGRDPVDAADPVGARGQRYDLFALPDLSRRLDKTHLLLERSETTVWVTDLDSSTGTAIVGAGGVRTPLAAEVRSAVPVGAAIECGGRRLTVMADG